MQDALTASVKRKLNITWSDEETDARVAEIVEDAKLEMSHKLGLDDAFDFSKPGQERNLLLSWCLYEWNHQASEFDANYLNDLMQCRHKHIVANHGEDDVDAVQSDQVQ